MIKIKISSEWNIPGWNYFKIILNSFKKTVKPWFRSLFSNFITLNLWEYIVDRGDQFGQLMRKRSSTNCVSDKSKNVHMKIANRLKTE